MRFYTLNVKPEGHILLMQVAWILCKKYPQNEVLWSTLYHRVTKVQHRTALSYSMVPSIFSCSNKIIAM